jgi:hypothetical protein
MEDPAGKTAVGASTIKPTLSSICGQPEKENSTLSVTESNAMEQPVETIEMTGGQTSPVLVDPPVPVLDESLNVKKQCVRAYVELREPLEPLPASFNPHGLNLEHLALPELGLHLRADESDAWESEPELVKHDNDWVIKENVLPIRATTAKRIWRQVETDSTVVVEAVNCKPVDVVALKKRCLEGSSASDEQLVLTTDSFVWERSRPGFSGENFLKSSSNQAVGCANTLKKKYEHLGRRRPRTIAGKINGLTKLAGGRPSRKSTNKTLVSYSTTLYDLIPSWLLID